MMSRNCSGSFSRPSVVTVNWKSCDVGVGGWPMRPAATWTFCSRIAARTSSVVRFRALSFSGSSQIRIP